MLYFRFSSDLTPSLAVVLEDDQSAKAVVCMWDGIS